MLGAHALNPKPYTSNLRDKQRMDLLLGGRFVWNG